MTTDKAATDAARQSAGMPTEGDATKKAMEDAGIPTGTSTEEPEGQASDSTGTEGQNDDKSTTTEGQGDDKSTEGAGGSSELSEIKATLETLTKSVTDLSGQYKQNTKDIIKFRDRLKKANIAGDDSDDDGATPSEDKSSAELEKTKADLRRAKAENLILSEVSDLPKDSKGLAVMAALQELGDPTEEQLGKIPEIVQEVLKKHPVLNQKSTALPGVGGSTVPKSTKTKAAPNMAEAGNRLREELKKLQ